MRHIVLKLKLKAFRNIRLFQLSSLVLGKPLYLELMDWISQHAFGFIRNSGKAGNLGEVDSLMQFVCISNARISIEMGSTYLSCLEISQDLTSYSELLDQIINNLS